MPPTPGLRTLARLAPLVCALQIAMTLSGCAVPATNNITTGSLPDISKVPHKDLGSALPEGWQHGAFMEIFVRAYRDSDGDGHGDLRGLTQSLDYLQDLGIKGIWLMPITLNADGDHGYAVKDFRAIDPAYGTLADFDELLREAHKRGIGVIMDYVLNHSSAENPLYVDAVSGPNSRFRNWFIWKDPAPTGWEIWGKNPWYGSPTGTFYGTFGPHMPDFNLENAEAMEYHRDSLRFWLNRGIDGFRLDAVPHLVETSAKEWQGQPGSFALMGHVKALMDSYQNRYAVCEATSNPTVWAAPYICGSAFSFGIEKKFSEAARAKPEAIRELADYFNTAPTTMATFVSNHDSFAGARLWDQVKGDLAQYRLAAATYLLMPGTPYIYFGEEFGMAGGAGLTEDAALRSPMSWKADATTGGFTTGKPFRPASANVLTHNADAAAKDANSLHAFYKSLIGVRNRLPSIARGTYEHANADDVTMSFQRRFGRERSLVVINYGMTKVPVRAANLPAGASLIAKFPNTSVNTKADALGNAMIEMEAQSARVFLVE
jgi:alpha-amylase